MSEAPPVVLSPPETPPRQETDMLPRVLRHSAWLFSSSMIARSVNFLRTLILARLLLPEDFGLFGLASSILGFTLVFGDVGIGPSLIYQKQSDRAYRDTAFWLNAGLSVALLGAVCLLAPAVATFYVRPGLAWIIIGLAGAFGLQMLGLVHRNWLRRELRFGVVATAEIAASLAALAVAASMALGGYGVWAFVWSLAAANLTSLLLMFRLSGWAPRATISRSAAREIGAFSGWYLGAAVTYYLAFGLDRLLIGKTIGFHELGYYVLAFNISITVQSATLVPLFQASTPEIASQRTDPVLFWNSYLRVSRVAAVISAPLALAAVLGAPLLPYVFGASWQPAVIPFQVLVSYIFLRSVIGDPFAASGRYDLAFRVGVGLLTFGFLAILLATRLGITAVAVTVSLISVCGLFAGVVLVGGKSALSRLLRVVIPYAGLAIGGAAAGSLLLAEIWRTVGGAMALVAAPLLLAGLLCVYWLVYRWEVRELAPLLPGRLARFLPDSVRKGHAVES